MCNEQSRQVGNTLTQNLLSFDAKVSGGTISIKLSRELRSFLSEPCPVLVGPPTTKSTAIVVDVPQFVEAMTDFMRKTSPRGSIVRGRVALRVEKRWLQYGC